MRPQLMGLINRLRRSQFARSVAVMASGTAGAQAITVAFAPIITRLYGPEAFGLLGTFVAMVTVAVPLAALAYPLAIVLPRDESNAKGLVKLSLGISFAVAAIAFLVFAAAGETILSAVGAQSIAHFALLIPAAMLFTAWMEIGKHWLIRHRRFRETARIAVTHALVVNIAKAGGGFFWPFGAALISLQTLGIAVHAIFLGRAAKKVPKGVPKECGQKRPTSLLSLARRHADFPLYRAPQVFLNAASQSLPILMLAALSGAYAVGFYALASSVLALPSRLLGKAVQEVFYPRINEAFHRGEATMHLILKATAGLFAVSLLPFMLIIVYGPPLFEMFFGDGWYRAGEYGQWLAAWLFVALVNRPSVAALPVLDLQGLFLLYEIASVLLRTGAIAFGFLVLQSDLMAIALFSVTGVMLNICLIVGTIVRAGRHDRGIFAPLSDA